VGDKHGIYKSELGVFGILKPFNIGTVWLVSCDVAAEESGQSFCQEFAKMVGALVSASDSGQEATLGQALEISLASTTEAINVFDGTVYSFSPSGSCERELIRRMWRQLIIAPYLIMRVKCTIGINNASIAI
jgi:hypothetical protein